ncbi:glycosyltransferase family protein [Endozoicomonas sp. 2B-B]
MKVLFLAQGDHGTTTFDRLYQAMSNAVEQFDLHWLTSEQQANLKNYFKDIDTEKYDRIIFFLRFKKEIKQVKFIQSVPNLVILEYDACQNYIKGKYEGKFSRHYRKLPWARIITSGYTLTQKLKDEGFDAVFVPKGYDSSVLKNKNGHRDIQMGFVGSIGHKIYRKRKEFIEEFSKTNNLVTTKTKTFDEYNNLLNRIRFFISADIGFGEYMQKNFEAMACGCVLCAWDQGEEENKANGLEDMKNIVLYKSKEELEKKLEYLTENPEKADNIAKAGQELAENRFSFKEIGIKVADALTPPLREKKYSSFFGIKKFHL